MCAALKVLLDQARGARDVLPYLAALEAALLRQGTAAIDAASTPVLQKIYSQLASLPITAADQPLQELLARLMVVLHDRAVHAEGHKPRQYLSTFVSDSRLMVSEGSHSEFLAAMDEPPDHPR